MSTNEDKAKDFALKSFVLGAIVGSLLTLGIIGFMGLTGM